MRQPLTPEERQALTDPEKLAQATAKVPFELRNRTVGGLKIPDLVLDHARFIGVDFLNVERASRTPSSIQLSLENACWNKRRSIRAQFLEVFWSRAPSTNHNSMAAN